MSPVPWRNTSVEKTRLEFIEKALKRNMSFKDLCNQYDISTKTGYKWLNRFREGGPKNLVDRSRRPNSQPNRTSPEAEELIISTRQQYSFWGAKKILPHLRERNPDITLPSEATVNNILKRHRLAKRGRYIPKLAGASPLEVAEHPNHIWTIDFKGWWKTKDQKICEPFTVQDMYSRYLLHSEPVPNRSTERIWSILLGLFQKYGMPERCRSDNGPPFASTGVGRLSRLSIRLVKSGIIPEWIRVGKPQDNGRHERMHRTMKEEVALIPASTIPKQKQQLIEFQHYYNNIRPHEALGGITPSEVYRLSGLKWNGIENCPEYPENYLIRKVGLGGQISLHGQQFFISEMLKNECIGLYEHSEDSYKLYYGPVCLGILNMTKGFKRS